MNIQEWRTWVINLVLTLLNYPGLIGDARRILELLPETNVIAMNSDKANYIYEKMLREMAHQ